MWPAAELARKTTAAASSSGSSGRPAGGHARQHDDQVGEDERDDATEADPAVPHLHGQRYVADRADEAEHRDDRADDRAPTAWRPPGARLLREPSARSCIRQPAR